MPFTLRLTPTLATVIGTFVFLTTASVLYVEGTASRRIVAGLGSRLVDLGMDAYEQRFSSKINILRNQAGFIAAAFARGPHPSRWTRMWRDLPSAGLLQRLRAPASRSHVPPRAMHWRSAK
ncbi:hypothetical protein V6L77_18380 [Pannonibacter sp. Pt2-lr]